MYRIFLWGIATLAVVFFNSGCSDVKTAEKRLSNELKFFAGQYVKNEFAKQIKLNRECKAFQVNENKLLLLAFDGISIVQRALPYSDLHEFAVSRYYVGQELNIECNEASWSKLTPVKHDKYSYRALVSFKFTDVRRMWQRVPGNSIVITAFKKSVKADQIKFELLNKATDALPGEKFDYYTVYSNAVQATERKFTTSFFVCYDPALPGWVPEDPELAGKIKVDAAAPDWLDFSIDKFNHSKQLERYKNDFYWNGSKLIRKNYDEGLVFRYNRWMTLAEAEETDKLKALENSFDPDGASIDDLTLFVHKLKGFSSKMDLTEAIQKAVNCAESQVNNLRNKNKYQELEQFLMLMQDNPDYAQVFSVVKDNIHQAISSVKRRINRQLENTIAEINAAFNAILKLKSGNLTANQINIECVRQKNSLKNLCQQKSADIDKLVFKIRFLLLLSRNYLEEVNNLYKHYSKNALLKGLEKSVLSRCKNCRKGIQTCIYCSKNIRLCSDCNGKKVMKNNERCTGCQGSGRCIHCKGQGTMNCMNCQKRGFVILHSKVKECLLENMTDLESLLKKYIDELESKKFKL